MNSIQCEVELFNQNLRELLTTNATSLFASENLTPISPRVTTTTYNETLTLANPLGSYLSLKGDALRDFFDRLKKFKINLEFFSLDVSENSSKKPECMFWQIQLLLDFTFRYAVLPMRITYVYVDCEAKYSPVTAKFTRIATWFSLAVLLFSFVSLCFVSYNIAKRSGLFVVRFFVFFCFFFCAVSSGTTMLNNCKLLILFVIPLTNRNECVKAQ